MPARHRLDPYYNINAKQTWDFGPGMTSSSLSNLFWWKKCFFFYDRIGRFLKINKSLGDLNYLVIMFKKCHNQNQHCVLGIPISSLGKVLNVYYYVNDRKNARKT